MLDRYNRTLNKENEDEDEDVYPSAFELARISRDGQISGVCRDHVCSKVLDLSGKRDGKKR